MAGTNDLIVLVLVGGALYIEFVQRGGQDLKGLIPSAGGTSAPSSSGGGYSKGGGYGGGGGYKGTPGWYTVQGHHHCSKGQGGFGGCVCTDPKKCFGHAGTGAQYCVAHQNECAPGPGECAWYYAADQRYCSLCPAGTAFKGNGSGAKAC